MAYLLSIDQGTTGSTAMVLDESLNVLASENVEFPQIFPKPGWVEHDPEEIWKSVLKSIKAALDASGIAPIELAAIGITNQRETTVVWDRKTGSPVYNAIVWQCRRTEDRCKKLREAGHENLVRQKTGLIIDPYFSGTKVGWILDETDSRARGEAGELAFGTIDSYLVARLTGYQQHVTDVSNASRTMLMNVQELQWEEEMLELLDVPEGMLPRIVGNAEVYGKTRGVPGLPDGIPIAGMAGDQQAALFGQACFKKGDAKCTYGTGAFLLMNTGNEVVYSDNGMLSTVGWQLGEGDETTWVLEGSVFIAGAIVQWLRDGLKFFSTAAEVEALAGTVKDTGGVVIVPSLTGLGAPHWNADARGVIWGLTRGTTRGHIARAALEGIAHQCTDVLEAMEQDLGEELRVLKVDGGAAENDLLMQIQSDLLGTHLVRPDNLQTTALGAALLAGLGAGVYPDLETVKKTWRKDRDFEPVTDEKKRDAMRSLWEKGLERV